MEEDIKILEEFINNYKSVQEKYKDDEIQAEIERSCYFEEVPAQALENLIKRYKELEEENIASKETINILTNKIEKVVDENKTLTDEYMIQKHLINADFLKDYISISVIQDKIDELYNKGENYIFNEKNNAVRLGKIQVLQDLLEERNN